MPSRGNPPELPKPARKAPDKATKSPVDAKPEAKPEAKPAADAKLKVAPEGEDAKAKEGPKVISLDAFRKKP